MTGMAEGRAIAFDRASATVTLGAGKSVKGSFIKTLLKFASVKKL